MDSAVAVPDRSKFLGGSDVAAVLGISKWRTPLDVALEKRRPRNPDKHASAKQKVLDRGHRWEPVAREMLVDALRDRGHEVEVIAVNEHYTDSEHPFLAAEIDCELRLDGQHVNGEIKTVHPLAIGDWQFSRPDEALTDSIPIYYATQVLFGQRRSKRDVTIVGALVGADEIHPFLVRHNAALAADVDARCIDFWQRYVLGNELPEPVNIADIRKLYRDAAAVPQIEATPEIQEAYLRLKALKVQEKAIECDIEALEFQIGRFMGAAQELTIDGKGKLTFKEHKGTWFDESALKEDNPKLFKGYVREWTKRYVRLPRLSVG